MRQTPYSGDARAQRESSAVMRETSVGAGGQLDKRTCPLTAGAAPVRRRAALVVQHGPQQHDRVRVDDVAVGCDTEEGRERARQHEPEGEVTRERALEPGRGT
eukprot:3885871-Prymnesium_polylepis.1